MPVKSNDKTRWVEMEFLVPGTPEQVWEAIATGPGISAWFANATVEEHVGGAVAFDFGGGATSSGKVTEWSPPHRLLYEEYGWAGEAPPLATEMSVRTISGGRCVLRIVHSLFTSDDQWDDQFDGFEGGWPGFVEVLRVYLRDFAGRKAGTIRVSGSHDGAQAEAWLLLSEEIGIAHANVGEHRDAPASTPALSGSVERIHQDSKSREAMLRLDNPDIGIALIGTYRWENETRAAVSIYFYGDDAEAVAARETPRWEAWIATHFPVQDTTTGKPA